MERISLKLLFRKRNKTNKEEDRIFGNIPLVTAGEGNLGVKSLISNEEQKRYSNRITIDMFVIVMFMQILFVVMII